HAEIGQYAEEHPETMLVFQPGTFQIKLGIEPLKNIYKNTFAFFCNVEEAQKILGTTEKDISKLLNAVHKIGPKNVFITDGMRGAYASNGIESWFMPVYPKDAYERTGAGDAFSSTVSIAL